MKAPSRKTGLKKRLTVAMGTVNPLCRHAALNSRTMRSRSAGVASMGTKIVVVEIHAPRANFTEQANKFRGRKNGANGFAKRVAAGIADGPQSERKFVFRFWFVFVAGHLAPRSQIGFENSSFVLLWHAGLRQARRPVRARSRASPDTACDRDDTGDRERRSLSRWARRATRL